MNPTTCRSAFLVLACLLCAASARAQLPNTFVLGLVTINRVGTTDTAALGSIGIQDPRYGGVSFSAQGQPFSAVQGGAHLSADAQTALLFGRGGGILRYGLAIAGPTPTVPVEIDVAGSAFATASAGASFAVAARWILWQSPAMSGALASDEIASGQLTGSFSHSFARTVRLTLETGHAYLVEMAADASAAASEPLSSADAQAFVDPLFRFGAGVDPALYSFDLSAGIGNAPVPEPAPTVLLLAGLGWLLLRRTGSRRRQRRRPAGGPARWASPRIGRTLGWVPELRLPPTCMPATAS